MASPGSVSSPEHSSRIKLLDVNDLPTVSAIESALEETNAISQEVEERLEGLLSRASAAAATRGLALAGIAQTAAVVADDAAELTAVFDSASRTALVVSARVRFLDSLLSVGNAALARVENVLTLRVCAEGAKAALSAGDLSSAASHVQKYLALDPEVRADPSSLPAIDQIGQSTTELTRKVREKADAVVNSAEGANPLPISSLLAALKLFGPIGLKQEGVKRFSQVLCNRIHRDAEQEVRSLLLDSAKHASEKGFPDGVGFTEGTSFDTQPHIAALSSVYEIVAGYLDQSEELVLETFGAPSYLEIMLAAQEQCDGQSDKILIRYSEFRRLDDISRATQTENASARDLDSLLNEMSVISQRTVAYFTFLKSRCATSFERGSSDSSRTLHESPGRVLSSSTKPEDNRATSPPCIDVTSAPDSEPKAAATTDKDHHAPASHAAQGKQDLLESFAKHLDGSKLASWANDMAVKYVNFEAYFMRQNARKAIRIDEVSTDSPLTSTAVDDFFFVLQKVVSRALSYGGSIDVLLSVLQHVNSSIAGDLQAFIRRRLRETEEILEKALVQSNLSISLPSAAFTVSYIAELAKGSMSSSAGLSDEKGGGGVFNFAGSSGVNIDADNVAKYDMFVALNNASVSAEYAVRFQSNLEQSALKIFSSSEESSKLSLAISQLGETARSLSTASDQGLLQLTRILTNRVSSTSDKLFADTHYIVPDASFEDNMVSSMSDSLLQEIETNVLPKSVEERLTEQNWDALVRHVAEWTATSVESKLFLPRANKCKGTQFNSLGGLRADRDVRGISAYFAAKCKRSSVRDVFARLSQIAMLVNLERPAEVYDIWGVNSGGMTWRLSSAEVRQVLLLRVDFKDDVVRALRL